MDDYDSNAVRFPVFSGDKGFPAIKWERTFQDYVDNMAWKKQERPANKYVYDIIKNCFPLRSGGDTWYIEHREDIEEEGLRRARDIAMETANQAADRELEERIREQERERAKLQGIIQDYEDHETRFSEAKAEHLRRTQIHAAWTTADEETRAAEEPTIPIEPPPNPISQDYLRSTQVRLEQLQEPRRIDPPITEPTEDIKYAQYLAVFWERFSKEFMQCDPEQIKRAMAMRQTFKGKTIQPSMLARNMWGILEHAVREKQITEKEAVTAYLEGLDRPIQVEMREFIRKNPPSKTPWSKFVKEAQETYMSLLDLRLSAYEIKTDNGKLHYAESSRKQEGDDGRQRGADTSKQQRGDAGGQRRTDDRTPRTVHRPSTG